MHSEVRQQGPGSCSVCGMALEPETTMARKVENPELVYFRHRFWVGLLLTLPVVILEMGSHFFHLNKMIQFITPSISNWLQLIFATPVLLWAGFSFFERGYKSFQTRSFNMFTLISLGSGLALGYSVVATIVPHVFPVSFRGEDGRVPVYFEVASVIIILVLLGQMLELKARERTGHAIRALLDLTPKKAYRLKENGEEEEVSIEKIHKGDQLRIHPGEKIPVDGVVIDGESYVDESMVTGESMPVFKTERRSVVTGTINCHGALIVQARKVGKSTLLSQIVDRVTKAQRSRASIQRMVDTVSGWFVPVVIFIAMIAFVSWIVFASSEGFSYGLIAAVSVLISACPCALGLATPMSIMVGVGRGAKSGILIKNAETLEILEKVDTLFVDKTGTLTEGRPVLTQVVTFSNSKFDEKRILHFAMALEKKSEHPLAKAIMQGAKDRGYESIGSKGFKAILGKGVRGFVDGREVVLGNESLMQGLSININHAENKVSRFRKEGETVVFVAIQGHLEGFIIVADSIKESTSDTIKKLKSEGLSIIMLTGDNILAAQAVARKLGIDKVYAGVLPTDKHRIIEEYRAKGAMIAMVGDGINDAPALAAAHVGIAMGTGADIAIEAAGVTLLKGDLQGIFRAIQLSRAVMRNIRQNLFFAFFYNITSVPIAAGLIYPLFGVLLSPILAAVAMSLSSVSVIVNALRLNFQKV